MNKKLAYFLAAFYIVIMLFAAMLKPQKVEKPKGWRHIGEFKTQEI